MNSTHLHLALTHFPIIGTIIGSLVLAIGIFGKKEDIQKVGLIIFILMGILAIPVFLTGEGAEETVEHLSDVSENAIHRHEKLAEIAIWIMAILGVFSFANLYTLIKGVSISKVLTVITFIVSLGTIGIFAQVGNLGGQIRHSEIRTGNQVYNAETYNPELNNRDYKKSNKEDDHDD